MHDTIEITFRELIAFIEKNKQVTHSEIIRQFVEFYRKISKVSLRGDKNKNASDLTLEKFEELASRHFVELTEHQAFEYHRVAAAMAGLPNGDVTIISAGQLCSSLLTYAVKFRGINKDAQIQKHHQIIDRIEERDAEVTSSIEKFLSTKEIDEISRSFKYVFSFNHLRFLTNLYKLPDPEFTIQKFLRKLSNKELGHIFNVLSQAQLKNIMEAVDYSGYRFQEIQKRLVLFNNVLSQTLVERGLLQAKPLQIVEESVLDPEEEIDIIEYSGSESDSDETPLPSPVKLPAPIKLSHENRKIIDKFIKVSKDDEMAARKAKPDYMGLSKVANERKLKLTREKDKLKKAFRKATENGNVNEAEKIYDQFKVLISHLTDVQKIEELQEFYAAGKYVAGKEAAGVNEKASVRQVEAGRAFEVKRNDRPSFFLRFFNSKNKFNKPLSIENKHFQKMLSAFDWWFSPKKFMAAMLELAEEIVLRNQSLLSDRNISADYKIRIYQTNLIDLLNLLPASQLKKFYSNLMSREFQELKASFDCYSVTEIEKDNAIKTLKNYLSSTLEVAELVLRSKGISVSKTTISYKNMRALSSRQKELVDDLVVESMDKVIPRGRNTPVLA